ncbi:hypothetical protein [Methylobacterium nodulans]|uniref:hypothetical protein n=1 Tax=Methylobacterium nodulans TaxID=114616 RepID=UPI0005C15912|nr:hypothetical protein [Methylobacterium nodulans]
MWVLFWIMVAQNGAVTSGSAEFESFEACRAAAGEVDGARAQIAMRAANTGQPAAAALGLRETRCLDRKTGRKG